MARTPADKSRATGSTAADAALEQAKNAGTDVDPDSADPGSGNTEGRKSPQAEADEVAKRQIREAEKARAEGGALPDGIGKSDYVVLVDAFVARTDAKSNATRRYGLGAKFEPVDGVHDVDALVRSKTIGKVSDRPSRTTALVAAQAQAEINQEDSPVLLLESRPFEVQTSQASQPVA